MQVDTATPGFGVQRARPELMLTVKSLRTTAALGSRHLGADGGPPVQDANAYTCDTTSLVTSRTARRLGLLEMAL